MAKPKEYTPKGEDVIRKEVLEDFKGMGYDPELEENKPLLESMVKRELDREAERVEHHKKLSKTIGQKVKLRTKLNEVLGGDDEDEENEEELDNNGQPNPKGDNKNTPQRHEVDTSNLVTKDELAALQQRQKYPNLTDEEYNSINALAKASGKSFEETMGNNVGAKAILEEAEARARVNGATNPPSHRTSANQVKTEEEKAAEELDSDLPPGFSSKKEGK